MPLPDLCSGECAAVHRTETTRRAGSVSRSVSKIHWNKNNLMNRNLKTKRVTWEIIHYESVTVKTSLRSRGQSLHSII